MGETEIFLPFFLQISYLLMFIFGLCLLHVYLFPICRYLYVKSAGGVYLLIVNSDK